jgi:hypothetical protein
MALAYPQPNAAATLNARPVTLGVIVGNRGFFPDHLALSGRNTILEILEKAGIRAIVTPEGDTNVGAIESNEEARMCADLFREHRDQIDGVLVTLPNFGDERAIANTLRWAGLNVPVLIHAFPDDATRMSISDRRDSFCGKMSACNNLRQYGIKYTITSNHTMDRICRRRAPDCTWCTATTKPARARLCARSAAFSTAFPTTVATRSFTPAASCDSGPSFVQSPAECSLRCAARAARTHCCHSMVRRWTSNDCRR